MVLAGLGYLWFFPAVNSRNDLPYLRPLVAALILETPVVFFGFVRAGTKCLPQIKSHRHESDTVDFMCKFIEPGTTVQIVSSRFAWARRAEAFTRELARKAEKGALVEIITPQPVDGDIRLPLARAGVLFYLTAETTAPEARFTLINGNRSGAERLAIARGSHPEHQVTVFDNNSGPEIIAMARDMIRKSKELASVRKMG